MNKRALAIVCGGNQLLFAAQVKHTLYEKIPMDMAYLDIDISEDAARQLFDGVFKIRSNVAPPKSKALRCFVFPKYAIKKFYAGIEPGDYTDFFFYGPTWLYYFLYKYSVYSRHKYSWHLLPEGAGLYLEGFPQIPPKEYGFKLFSKFFIFIDSVVFGYSKKNIEMIEDIYLIHPEFSRVDDGAKKVSIPPFNPKECEYINTLNAILKYDHVDLRNKVIIMDGGLGRSRMLFYDENIMDMIITMIGNLFGQDNVLLKRKHGVGLEQYDMSVVDQIGVYEKEDMPWELVCLNGDVKDCVIVSVPTSAIILPFIFCGFTIECILIGDSIVSYNFDHKQYRDFIEFANMTIKETGLFYIADSIEDMENSLRLLNESLIKTIRQV